MPETPPSSKGPRFALPEPHELRNWLRHMPNKLTLARIAVIPLLLLLHPFFPKQLNILCAVIFALGAFTDFLDGWLARKYDNVTALGALLDPIADKMLIAAALVLLAASGKAPAFVCALIICRDIAVNGVRLLALERGRTVAVSEYGKWKTAVLCLAIFCLFINETRGGVPYRGIGMVSLWAALGLALYSGWAYGRAYLVESESRR
jgi:CDP-diacylglycerol--glycerol-3-phosphate 3-phosphatidyltransferase